MNLLRLMPSGTGGLIQLNPREACEVWRIPAPLVRAIAYVGDGQWQQTVILTRQGQLWEGRFSPLPPGQIWLQLYLEGEGGLYRVTQPQPIPYSPSAEVHPQSPRLGPRPIPGLTWIPSGTDEDLRTLEEIYATGLRSIQIQLCAHHFSISFLERLDQLLTTADHLPGLGVNLALREMEFWDRGYEDPSIGLLNLEQVQRLSGPLSIVRQGKITEGSFRENLTDPGVWWVPPETTKIITAKAFIYPFGSPKAAIEMKLQPHFHPGPGKGRGNAPISFQVSAEKEGWECSVHLRILTLKTGSILPHWRQGFTEEFCLPLLERLHDFGKIHQHPSVEGMAIGDTPSLGLYGGVWEDEVIHQELWPEFLRDQGVEEEPYLPRVFWSGDQTTPEGGGPQAELRKAHFRRQLMCMSLRAQVQAVGRVFRHMPLWVKWGSLSPSEWALKSGEPWAIWEEDPPLTQVASAIHPVPYWQSQYTPPDSPSEYLLPFLWETSNLLALGKMAGRPVSIGEARIGGRQAEDGARQVEVLGRALLGMGIVGMDLWGPVPWGGPSPYRPEVGPTSHERVGVELKALARLTRETKNLRSLTWPLELLITYSASDAYLLWETLTPFIDHLGMALLDLGYRVASLPLIKRSLGVAQAVLVIPGPYISKTDLEILAQSEVPLWAWGRLPREIPHQRLPSDSFTQGLEELCQGLEELRGS